MADISKADLEELVNGISSLTLGFNRNTDIVNAALIKAKKVEQAKKEIHNKKVEELNQSIENWRKVFDKFGLTGALQGATSTEGAYMLGAGATGGVLTTILGAISALSGAASVLISPSGPYSAVLRLVSGITGTAGAAIKAAGDLVSEGNKVQSQMVFEATRQFMEASNLGVVESYSKMVDLMEDTGLSMGSLAQVMAKNSQNFIYLGDSAVDGAKAISSMLKENLKEYGLAAMELGMTVDEYSDIQIKNATWLAKAGLLQGQKDKNYTRSAKELTENLVVLSRLTGKRREELLKEREAAQADARVRAFEAELAAGPEGAKRLKIFQNLIRRLGESGKGVAHIIAARGAMTSTEARQVGPQLLTAGLTGERMHEMLMAVENEDPILQLYYNAKATFTKQNNRLAAIVGEDDAYFKGYAKSLDEAGLAAKNIPELSEAIRGSVAATKDTISDVTKVMFDAHKMANSMQRAAIESGGLIKINNGLRKVINDLIDKIPSARKILDSRKFPTINFNSPPSGSTTSAPGTSRSGTGAGAGMQRPDTPQISAGGIKGLLDFIARYEAHGGNYNVLVNRKGSKTAITAKEAYGGKELTQMTVGEVMQLQQKMAADGFPSSAAVGRYQIINTTLREMLKPAGVNETDLFNETTQDRLAMQILIDRVGLNKYLSKQMSKDEFADNIARRWFALPNKDGISFNHARGDRVPPGLTRQQFLDAIPGAAKGALIAPTPGGTLLQVGEGGQAEAIVPLPDGRSIPVTFTSTSGNSKQVLEAFQKLSTKFDDMISLISEDNGYRRNIVIGTS